MGEREVEILFEIRSLRCVSSRWAIAIPGFLLLVREVFGSTVVALGAVLGTVLVAALGAVFGCCLVPRL